jgi:hypothetical protein
MLDEIKLFKKRFNGHKDYFFENEERMFKYFEMMLWNQH